MIMKALLLLIAVAVANPSSAHADNIRKPTNPAAKARGISADRLYKAGEFEKAIEELKAALVLEPSPVFQYNLGQCYRQLGDYQRAIWHYEQFLSHGMPEGDLKLRVDGFIKQMTDELTKQAMRQPPTGPLEQEPTKPAPLPQQDRQALTHVIDPGEPWYRDNVGWVLAGAGLVGGGASVGLFLNADGLKDDANSTTDQQLSRELRSRADDRRLIATFVGIAGGAILATGIVKLALYPKDRERRVQNDLLMSRRRARPTSLDVGLTRSGVVVMGRF